MPKQATGHVRWINGVATARIRITADVRESFALPSCRDDAAAHERARVLAEVAQQLRRVQAPLAQAREALKNIGGAVSPRSLRNALDIAAELIGGDLAVEGAPPAPTFGQIGEDWTSGKLAERYPDQIKIKRSAKDDVSRLTNYVYPLLRDIPIDRVTLDQCEEVMRRLPADLATATRQRIGAIVARILALAVYPLRHIERSPIPKGFLPIATKTKALAYLYPDEDRRLLACAAVPFEWRLLWGFLAREGMRANEALTLTWSDLDLKRGAVRLDKNKTDDPRAWALSAGVKAALTAYRERWRPHAEPGAVVFVDPDGAPFSRFDLARMFRAHLRAIALDKERPELFVTTAERQRIRVHDLRATFVTIGLANGCTEAWISDRTGHQSSSMINRYRRAARNVAELDQGTLAPLDDAIPELAIGPGLGHSARNTLKRQDPPTAVAGVANAGPNV